MAAVAQLGYLGFQVRDLGAWEHFATQVLGLTVSERDDKSMSLRMDGFARRFLITEGPADDLSLIGWQVVDADALEALVDKLRGAGVDVVEAGDADADARGVQRLFRFADLDGIQSELCIGQAVGTEPFASALVPGGFVADELGLGHCVIGSQDKARSEGFYSELLGFKLSDEVKTEIQGFKVDVSFFHVNARHHSLAFGGPQKKRIHHFMIEARDIDAVGLALDRTLKAGLRVVQTLGRHPNDRMFSFYALTPSRFQFEFGWGGRMVDDAVWTPVVHDRISEWGHLPPQAFTPPKKAPSEESHG